MHRNPVFSRMTLLAMGFTALFSIPLPAKAMDKLVTLGTGDVMGGYFPLGGAIAQIINAQKADYGIRIGVESTSGAVSNISDVANGELDFGIAPSDQQYHAFTGTKEWSNTGPKKNLRAVCSIGSKAVTLVAATDAGIRTLMDLKGKRVNICPERSLHRQTAIDALESAGLDFSRDFRALQKKADEAVALFQSYRIDAFFYTIDHPSGLIKEAASGRRKIRIIPINGIDALLAEYPYYIKTEIPIDHYPKAANRENIVTFGIRETIFTSAAVPDTAVYAFTKGVFNHLIELKGLHPGYSYLTKDSMLEGFSAPIHPGALKYFKETGLK